MKIRALFIAGLSILAISTTANGIETSKKKTTSKEWTPPIYDLKTERLPAGYTGVDPNKFFKMFESKLGALKKGEFETTEEFAIRSSDDNRILAPISTNDLYAFRIPLISVTYDADIQTYSIGSQNSYECKETYASSWVKCKVGFSSSQNDTYQGVNAYGASINVRRVRGVSFALAIHGDAPVFKTHLKQLSRSNLDYHTYLDTLPIPLEKARTLKNETITVLFVGKITEAKIDEGISQIEKPTIDSPSDTIITENAVRFDLKRIIYYVLRTGEILKQQDF